jgi:hypothetical protein
MVNARPQQYHERPRTSGEDDIVGMECSLAGVSAFRFLGDLCEPLAFRPIPVRR